MPIRPKRPSEAATERALETEVPLTPRRQRIDPERAVAAPDDGAAAAPDSGDDMPAPPRRRGHAQKDENGKWLPTGDYGQGFCKPPPEHQFKAGNPGGPGRPKKQPVVFDELLTKLALTKMRVAIDGKPQMLPKYEAFLMRVLNDGLGGKSPLLQKFLFDEFKRVFPSNASPGEAASVSAGRMDELILKQFFAGLTLGEPGEGGFDPMADALQAPPRADIESDPDWDEGAWDSPAEGEDDEGGLSDD